MTYLSGGLQQRVRVIRQPFRSRLPVSQSYHASIVIDWCYSGSCWMVVGGWWLLVNQLLDGFPEYESELSYRCMPASSLECIIRLLLALALVLPVAVVPGQAAAAAVLVVVSLLMRRPVIDRSALELDYVGWSRSVCLTNFVTRLRHDVPYENLPTHIQSRY